MMSGITVAIPQLPMPLEHLGTRHFSFFPPILGFEKNEWLFRRAAWTEMVVVNAQSGLEVLIPRRFVGEVSSIEDPVLIVGLLQELEYREGAVWPHVRRVIEMPVAVGAETPRSSRRPAPVVRISLAAPPRKKTARMVFGVLISIVLALAVVMGLIRLW